MFFRNDRLYYTLTGDARLFYRWFTPESGVIGADTFVASGPTTVVSTGLGTARGLLVLTLPT
jgi:hypothetical protein